MVSNEKSAKICSRFYCENCDYSTSKTSSYNEHLLSLKHKKSMVSNKNQSKICSEYICQTCNKKYKDNSGLWRHKKKCNYVTSCKNLPENLPENLLLDKGLIMEIIKNNTDVQKMMMDVIKNGTNNTINSNNTTNKTFNLNLYLNETCKDAMNISEFVSSIKLNLDDLEHTGRNGYVEGISNIFLKNLNDIEDHMRPIHCSDQKREILYIKDNDKWEKECNNKPILTKAIKNVANENIKQIKNWRDKNPDCTNSNSTKNDLYLKIVSNSMNGLTEEEGKRNINKIISNVAKEVTIDKN